jgi:hypothetical protein
MFVARASSNAAMTSLVAPSSTRAGWPLTFLIAGSERQRA